MLCDNCKQNTATVNFKQVINGEETAMHLCPSCAAQMGGFASLFGGDLLSPGVLFGQANAAQTNEGARCPGCGSSFTEIVKSGKFGCPACYTHFEGDAGRMINRIHGNVTHQGKIPKSAGSAITAKREMEEKKAQLAACIESQDFEQAAKLRDEIALLEQNREGGGEHA